MISFSQLGGDWRVLRGTVCIGVVKKRRETWTFESDGAVGLDQTDLLLIAELIQRAGQAERDDEYRTQAIPPTSCELPADVAERVKGEKT